LHIAKVINNSLITGSNKQAFERLELYTGKPVRTVVRPEKPRTFRRGKSSEEIISNFIARIATQEETNGCT
jgi:hypothetical protein